MTAIRVLPETVANQIAAGEVIERPANVVKELLENSPDAGATRIFIEFYNGGIPLIRIRDNGCGMDEEDACLCSKRRASDTEKQNLQGTDKYYERIVGKPLQSVRMPKI